MPREAQYFEPSHALSDLVPLLALQPMQHSAMFSELMMLASLTMCSHDRRLPRA